MSNDAATEAFKAATPVSVLSAYAAGFTVNEWAAMAALIYTLWLISEKAVTTWFKLRDWRAKRDRPSA